MNSFMALAILLDPRASPSYEGFTAGVSAQGIPLGNCSMMRIHGTHAEDGPQKLPDDYKDRISTLKLRVLRDTTEPADVRSAAACI